MRYRFIREQHQWHRLTALCRVMKVSRSGYYQWLSRKPCARVREDERLWAKVRDLHYERREAYGSKRLEQDLRAKCVFRPIVNGDFGMIVNGGFGGS